MVLIVRILMLRVFHVGVHPSRLSEKWPLDGQIFEEQAPRKIYARKSGHCIHLQNRSGLKLKKNFFLSFFFAAHAFWDYFELEGLRFGPVTFLEILVALACAKQPVRR